MLKRRERRAPIARPMCSAPNAACQKDRFRAYTASMTKRLILCVVLWVGYAAWAETVRLNTLQVGATTYSNVVILGANTTDLYFRHSQARQREAEMRPG
jgi:hypothetical protein